MTTTMMMLTCSACGRLWSASITTCEGVDPRQVFVADWRCPICVPPRAINLDALGVTPPHEDEEYDYMLRNARG